MRLLDELWLGYFVGLACWLFLTGGLPRYQPGNGVRVVAALIAGLFWFVCLPIVLAMMLLDRSGARP